jgi:N-acetylmuramoyl-L-alanine amidase
MTDPTRAPCAKDYYPAVRTSGRRPLSAVMWIVLHSTEGGTAASVARYFQSPSADGSTHLVVDDDECQRCLPNSARCWGAPGANYNGLHIEQCGFARWSNVDWKSHLATLKRAAYKTAIHCDMFGIPPVFRNAAGLDAARPGITTHAECSEAFGGSHWDPGAGWPRSLFMSYVKRYLKEIQATDNSSTTT